MAAVALFSQGSSSRKVQVLANVGVLAGSAMHNRFYQSENAPAWQLLFVVSKRSQDRVVFERRCVADLLFARRDIS